MTLNIKLCHTASDLYESPESVRGFFDGSIIDFDVNYGFNKKIVQQNG